MNGAATIWRLGIKELRSLGRDRVLLALVLYSFSLGIYAAAEHIPETLHRAPIAIVDEDRSQLSTRIAAAFYPPHFMPPSEITAAEMDRRLDAGDVTFALVLPVGLQRDVLRGERPAVQLNVDATRVSQAFTGAGYIAEIVSGEVAAFVARYRSVAEAPAELTMRARYNPLLTFSWFGAVMELVNNVTLLSIILTGAALIREREHGTIEHLLVMPVTPLQIMLGKVWAMGAVVLAASAVSIALVVRMVIGMPVEGSVALFLAGAGLHLFATTSLGIFLATLARSMPQFGLLTILVILPLEMLSGGQTPRENMPEAIQAIMSLAPTTHFVTLSQAILFRGAGIEVVWPQFLALLAIGTALFAAALARFRVAIAQ
ncbi:hypothetical protein DLJ53_04960 [Acuticoccus sediminis]|uniref:ABC transmembrane type-2 domain-containing protein n=1 Tax=Acuticoccus sediminis TaxID=2184697 RepID=A0A8B2P1I4_9HYPH|nr:ABC transporter permease [Acuticoccus sediminis]RAI03824.1 hypothetical protein DLJ53_04960 [Acuticoccus sediminis]